MTHGPSGHERSFGYDPVTHRLTNIAAGSDGNLVLSLDYQHDNNGNITTIIDHTNQHQQSCFTYDPVQRLTRAATSGFTGCDTPDVYLGNGESEHDYTYDPLGKHHQLRPGRSRLHLALMLAMLAVSFSIATPLAGASVGVEMGPHVNIWVDGIDGSLPHLFYPGG